METRKILFIITISIFCFAHQGQAQDLANLSNANFEGETLPEGFDRQSPREIEEARREIGSLFQDAISPDELTENDKDRILEAYSYVDPHHLIPRDLLEPALLFFDQNQEKFPNHRSLSVVDYHRRSDSFRFFIVDLKTGAVHQYHTTHGRGSDRNRDGYAERFSNVVNSQMSSLGFVRTGEVYSGKYRRSLRLDGLSATNSNLRARAVVVHGSDYVHEQPVLQGLSMGCLALDWRVKDQVISQIRDGSLMYLGVSSSRRWN